jgi:hypothetical protein
MRFKLNLLPLLYIASVVSVLYERIYGLPPAARLILVVNFTVLGIAFLLAAIFLVAAPLSDTWNLSREMSLLSPAERELVRVKRKPYRGQMLRPRFVVLAVPVVMLLASAFFFWPVVSFLKTLR